MIHLPTADIVVLAAYLLLVTGFGVALARRQVDSRAYFLGNRNIPWWAVCLSVVATETSVLTFIGVPALSYEGDLRFLQLTAGYLAARILLAVFFLPAFLEQDTYTVYGFLTRRFGPRARSYAAGLFFATQILGSGVRLYAAALVLAAVLEVNSIATAIVLIAGVTILYTWAGGISAVIWTDCLQAVIMIGGGVLALWLLAGMFPQGLSGVLAVAATEGKLRLWDFTPSLTSNYTFWSGLVGGTFLGMASHGTDQVLAQRLLTSRSLADGRKAIVGSALIIIPQFLLFLLIGVLLHYYYLANPPAVPFEKADQIFPHFIVHRFPPVAAGLVVAAMFGAAMSTLDSGIQALSVSTVMDVVRPLSRSRRPESGYLGLSRVLVVFWGAVLVVVALFAEGWGPVLETGLTVASYTYGPLLGLFLLGFFTRVSASRAVTTAVAAGLAGIVLVVRLTGLAFTWYVFTGALITVATGLAVQRLGAGRSAPPPGQARGEEPAK
ncbi:MAG: sodium:solute symporter [Candidatus Glassbacteria bacterium]|nr:sodium:solute symporter [Candidatus Glassbacteria bacterium]